MAEAKPKKTRSAAGTRTRRKPAGASTGLTATELQAAAPPGEVAALHRAIDEDGGKVLSVYREPYGGRWLVLAADPSNDLAGNMFDALEAKAEKPEKRDPEILVREAKCLARRGLTDRAVLLLETLLSFCADHAEAHNDLGNLYCLLQKPDKGLFHLERAVHLAPEKIEYLRDLADGHLAEEGDLERVLGLYNKALALKPDDIETLLRIGNICAVQKQYDDARFFYNRVQSIEPENTQARENLAVLQSMSANEPSQGRSAHKPPNLSARL